MKILSVNFNHDGAGCIVEDGQVRSYICTERFSRFKKHPGMRTEDLHTLLDDADTKLTELDWVMVNNLNCFGPNELPLIHGSDLKDTWFNGSVNKRERKATIEGITIPCILNPPHHELHAYLVYLASPFDSAMVWSWDPTGQGAYIGEGSSLKRVSELIPPFRGSGFYSLCAQNIFENGLFGAGKVMGLAPYGEESDTSMLEVDIDSDDVIEYLRRLRRESQNNPIWVKGQNGQKWNATFAYYAQVTMEQVLIEVVNRMADYAEKEGIPLNLCLTGGGSLNSVANEKAFKQSKFENIYIHPACGDDGTVIGAALGWYHRQRGGEKHPSSNQEAMYSFRTYKKEIDDVIDRPEYANKIIVERSPEYTRKAAELLSQEKIIGWYQGASEIGPRALGNRSIIADPRGEGMKDKLNHRVKFREPFRPFAPSVLNEHSMEWFGIKDCPFMLRVAPVLKEGVPAITHVDKTARIQTVTAEDNKGYYDLISNFHKITNIPMVLNTSFNIKGEPIVETPEDAMKCFLKTDMDHLVFPGIVLSKRDQE